MLLLLTLMVFVADAAAVNPNGIKTTLANDLTTFFIKDKPSFSNGPRILSENLSNFIILDK